MRTGRGQQTPPWLNMHLVTGRQNRVCISPNKLLNGIETACHKCWQCREQAINDWVGRNIAESKTAIASHAITLTYGRVAGDADHPSANILTYSDVQKWFKLLRFHGYPCRYFVAGEFGTLKGRAHWHVMIYWQKRVPPGIVLDRNFMQAHWPHGWSYWTKPTHLAVRYNCKYLQKDMGAAERQGHLAMSKKPPLGTAYFQQEAERYVAQGLAPQTLEYKFPEVTRLKQDGTREVIPFRLKDRPADLFLQHYLDTWRRVRPGMPVPQSPMIDEWLDPLVKQLRIVTEWFAALPPMLTSAQRVEWYNQHERLKRLKKGLPAEKERPGRVSKRDMPVDDPTFAGAVLDKARADAEALRRGPKKTFMYRYSDDLTYEVEYTIEGGRIIVKT